MIHEVPHGPPIDVASIFNKVSELADSDQTIIARSSGMMPFSTRQLPEQIQNIYKVAQNGATIGAIEYLSSPSPIVQDLYGNDASFTHAFNVTFVNPESSKQMVYTEVYLNTEGDFWEFIQGADGSDDIVAKYGKIGNHDSWKDLLHACSNATEPLTHASGNKSVFALIEAKSYQDNGEEGRKKLYHPFLRDLAEVMCCDYDTGRRVLSVSVGTTSWSFESDGGSFKAKVQDSPDIKYRNFTYDDLMKFQEWFGSFFPSPN